MGTTLRIKIVRPTSAAGATAALQAEEPEPELELASAAAMPGPDVPAGEGADPIRPAGGGSTSVREFLAMRRRQREQRRARALRMRAGAVIVASAMVVVGVFVFRDWQLSSVTVGPAPASAAAVTAAGFGAGTGSGSGAPAPAARALASVAPLAPAGSTEVGAPAASACEAAFSQREWRAALESCTAAFEAAPSGTLALKVAHAHWARANVALAGQWAQTSLRLGNEDPDAHVLVGHSRRRAGDRIEALDSYRRYLAAAPRGWHARKVRWLVKRLNTPRSASASAVVTTAPATSSAEGAPGEEPSAPGD